MEAQSRRRAGVKDKRANDQELMALMASIASGDTTKVMEVVAAHPDLVQIAAPKGASRTEASEYFFPEIKHYVYAGDTALHIAAAGFRFEAAQLLIGHGANVTAKNRRGAEPLHYAADSIPGIPPRRLQPLNAWSGLERIRTRLTRAASPQSIAQSAPDARPPSRLYFLPEQNQICRIRTAQHLSILQCKTPDAAAAVILKRLSNSARSSCCFCKTGRLSNARIAPARPWTKLQLPIGFGNSFRTNTEQIGMRRARVD
jgi:hypothetical protein